MNWHRVRRNRQPAPRRPGHDYSEPGFYFITAVTRGRAPLLAAVRGRTLALTPEGHIVARAIADVVEIAPGVTVDASVVMPDHVHVIFRLEFAGMVSVRQLVGRFKGRSANDVNVYWKSRPRPLWQRGFYDKVARTPKELAAYRRYIAANPRRWIESHAIGRPPF